MKGTFHIPASADCPDIKIRCASQTRFIAVCRYFNTFKGEWVARIEKRSSSYATISAHARKCGSRCVVIDTTTGEVV